MAFFAPVGCNVMVTQQETVNIAISWCKEDTSEDDRKLTYIQHFTNHSKKYQK